MKALHVFNMSVNAFNYAIAFILYLEIYLILLKVLMFLRSNEFSASYVLIYDQP